jgi:hypothetical protein
MGMYTELFIQCRLKKVDTVPDYVIPILEFMMGDGEVEPSLPSHSFFKTGRWGHMLRSNSYYLTPISVSKLQHDNAGQYTFIARCDLKNYEGEIEHFIDWLTPYIDASDGEVIGHTRYEEEDIPTLLVHPNTWREIVFKPARPLTRALSA